MVSSNSTIGTIPKLTGKAGNEAAPFCVQVASDAWQNAYYSFTLSLSYNSGMTTSFTFQAGCDYAAAPGSGSLLTATGWTTQTAINGPNT
jgi:hypothetical protein